MNILYTEQDLAGIRRQLKSRTLVLASVSVVFVALIVWALLMDDHREQRPEVLTTVLVLLWGFFVVFWWDIFCHPLRCYQKHLLSALHGRTHEIEVVYASTDGNRSVVDGVTFQDMIFLGDADKHGDRERRFYWDTELPLPEFTPGQALTLQYYDRFITGYGNSPMPS